MAVIGGIDPGKRGAIVLLSPNACMKFLLENMTYVMFKKIMEEAKPDHIYLEKAQVMGGENARAMFSYGTGYGKLIGWIDSLFIPYTLVAPVTWTTVMHKGCTGIDPKKKSLQAAQRLFPLIDLRATERCKNAHDGFVDALLIAEYGRRNFV